MKFRWNKLIRNLFVVALPVLFLSACELDEFRRWMYDTGRVKPYEKSNFFKDGSTARPLVEGTIPRGHLNEDELYYTGKVDGKYSTLFPFALNKEQLLRGKERYEIFCSVCHGPTGIGNGMIVQRGFKKPPSLHEKRLQDMPVGYFFDVASNGFATMPAYRTMIPTQDRWLIVAYLRSLQRSQNVRAQDIPDEEKASLDKSSELPTEEAL